MNIERIKSAVYISHYNETMKDILTDYLKNNDVEQNIKALSELYSNFQKYNLPQKYRGTCWDILMDCYNDH